MLKNISNKIKILAFVVTLIIFALILYAIYHSFNQTVEMFSNITPDDKKDIAKLNEISNLLNSKENEKEKKQKNKTVYQLEGSGPIGDQGELGDKGPEGEKGNQGNKGPVGFKGLTPEHIWEGTKVQFEHCENGEKKWSRFLDLKGDKGEKGDSVDSEVSGYSIILNPADDKYGKKIDFGRIIANWGIRTNKLDGPKGYKGFRGERGPKGDKGEKGERGGRGKKGYKGIIGKMGPVGERGNKGPTGIIGEKGDTGFRGIEGETGPQGDAGKDYIYYLDNIGKKGQTGDIGVQGETGPQGIMGNIGPAGVKGIRGNIGPTGKKGPTGPRGLPGLRGPDGVFKSSTISQPRCNKNNTIYSIKIDKNTDIDDNFKTKLQSAKKIILSQAKNLNQSQTGKTTTLIYSFSKDKQLTFDKNTFVRDLAQALNIPQNQVTIKSDTLKKHSDGVTYYDVEVDIKTNSLSKTLIYSFSKDKQLTLDKNAFIRDLAQALNIPQNQFTIKSDTLKKHSDGVTYYDVEIVIKFSEKKQLEQKATLCNYIKGANNNFITYTKYKNSSIDENLPLYILYDDQNST